MLWSVSVLIIGLARAQAVGTFRAAAAVFLPLAVALAAPLMGLIAAIASMLAKWPRLFFTPTTRWLEYSIQAHLIRSLTAI
jgi:hypothetical protein